MNDGLTVIIPCRNEYDSIREVVREIDNVMYRHDIPGNIMVIDDNSFPPLTWDDFAIPVMHRTHEFHKNILGPGLGGALNPGIMLTNTMYVLFMSGDGTDRPCVIPIIYKKLCQGYDCVFGQRRWSMNARLSYPLSKYNLNRLGNRLISLFFDRRYTDYTDMFKGYRLNMAHLGLSCKAKGFAFPMELCLRSIMSGARYIVVPTAPRYRTRGKSKFRLWHEVPEYLITLWRCLKLKWKGVR